MKHRYVDHTFLLSLGLFIALSLISLVSLQAETLTIGGSINQSVQDGTGPAANNPFLNQISDGDAYRIDLSFADSISSPGTYMLTGVKFFTDKSVTEDNFTSASVTIVRSGGFDTFSVVACLATGSACNQGNELDLNFMIHSADLTSLNVVPMEVAALLPLDLLEDDGVTDIHGVVRSYSNTSPAAPPLTVPEPSQVAMVLSGAGATLAALRVMKQRFKN